MVAVYNRTIGPLVADAEGRTIGGHDSGDADDSYPPVARAIERGLFRVEKTKKTTRKRKSTASDKADEEN